MERLVQCKRLFFAALLGWLFSSISVLLISSGIEGSGAGIVFWLGLIFGSSCYIWATRILKNTGKQTRIPCSLRFFSKGPARVTDVILIVSLVLTIYFATDYKSNQTVAAVILFLLVISVYAHLLFNGKIYKYIWNKKTRKGGATYEKVDMAGKR